MPAATNEQVQQFVNTRLRPSCNQMRALMILLSDHKAAFDDVYANVSDAGTTWTDTRVDFPPHLLEPSDVLAWNTFVTAMIHLRDGTFPDVATANAAAAQWAIIIKACNEAPALTG